jgi:uncharacterized protein with HEPN domain
MTKHDPEVALRQMLSHAREAVSICKGKSRFDLDSNRLLNLALTRLIEVIGESANRVPHAIQNEYPELPWLQMIGARNRLIHGYDSVDFDVLWMIVENDLPSLITHLQKILDDDFPS